MLILTSVLFLILIAGLLLFYWRRRFINQKHLRQLKMKLFLIKLPLNVKNNEQNLKQEINQSEQFFSALTSFKEPVVFEAGIPYLGQEISFYAAVSEHLEEAFVKQIHAVWHRAEVEPVEDYNIFNYQGSSSGVFIKQKERFILPIRTYQMLEADTFAPILGGFVKINEIGEGAALQVIVKPAPKRKKEILSALKVLKKGWKLKDVLKHSLSLEFSDVVEALSSSKNTKKENDDAVKLIDENAIKALEMKLSKPLFAVNVRVVVSAATSYEVDTILNSITAGFAQFSAPSYNELKPIKPRRLRHLFHQFSFREFSDEQSMILNSEELVSFFHFPISSTLIPKIKYLKAKEAPPPANLPKQGILIGQSRFRGETVEVRIDDDDRRRHIYIIGQTGTGKSNLLTNMAHYDIKTGRGLAVIDPHGDLINDLLSLVPSKRFDDVILFDPSDLERPIGFNMLEYDFNKPEQKTFIVNEIVNILDKLYDLRVTGGPMFEQYMRNALLVLMEDAMNEPATLMEIARVFSDVDFRDRKLKRIHNPTVIDFWEKEATKAGGEAALANITPYITSKFNTFTANDYMRLIIGQAYSSFNFRQIMDEGKILLVNLAKGRIGDLNANLLGMIIVGKILMNALSRVDIPLEQRRDFYLYIDEFQNFTTDSIATILSEARKYRLSLTIAHQFIAQLPDKIREAVFGNVGSFIAFRISNNDAEYLSKQFMPVFDQNDLVNIDNFNAYVKLLINGTTSQPFNIKTLPAEKGRSENNALLREISRRKYGRDRQAVESEILKRLRT